MWPLQLLTTIVYKKETAGRSINGDDDAGRPLFDDATIELRVPFLIRSGGIRLTDSTASLLSMVRIVIRPLVAY
jgi:hypothetical protein